MIFLTSLAVNKEIKFKRNFEDNLFHNIFRLFDVLPSFLSTKSETMRNYYLQTWYVRVASRVPKRLKT